MGLLATKPFPNPSRVQYPPDSVLDIRAASPIPMPGYLKPTIDPTFGNTVTRICDQTVFGTSELPLTHNYSKTSVWNADESLILLDWFWGRGRLLDGSNYKYLRQINIPNGRHSGRWSNVNPDNLYGIADSAGDTGNVMVVTHPLSDTALTPAVTNLHTFSQFDVQMSFGMEEGNFSHDDSVGAVIGWSNTQNKWGICSFRMTNLLTPTPTITEIATFWLPSGGGTRAAPNWDNITVSPKGTGILIQYKSSGTGTAQGIWWYAVDFSGSSNVNGSGGHWAIGLDERGDEFICSVGGSNGIANCLIAGYKVTSSGPVHPGVNVLATYPEVQSAAFHVSARNIDRPGWMYFSDMQNDPLMFIGLQHIFALKLDGSETVEVFGVNHGSYNASLTDNTYTARGVPNRSGTRIIFDSDWGGGTSSPAYDYVITAPGQVPSTMQFEGQAKKMTAIGGGLNTSTSVNDQSQTPDVWSSLGYINGDVSLVSDAHYGKSYRMHVNEASHTPWYDPGTDKGATELDCWRPAYMDASHPTADNWEWYAMAWKLDPSWVQPTWADFLEPNFPGITSPPMAVRTAYRQNSNGLYCWTYANVGASTLYWNMSRFVGTYGSMPAASIDYWLMPVQLNKWTEFVWGIKWSTVNAGAFELYTRVWEDGESNFTLRASGTNVMTYQSYSDGSIGRDPTTDVVFLYQGTEPTNGWPSPLWDNYANLATYARFGTKDEAMNYLKAFS